MRAETLNRRAGNRTVYGKFELFSGRIEVRISESIVPVPPHRLGSPLENRRSAREQLRVGRVGLLDITDFCTASLPASETAAERQHGGDQADGCPSSQ
jgi:hypothetical protein